jgi:hypothetical protein
VTSSPAKPHGDLERAAHTALFIDPWYSAENLRCVAKPEAEYIAQASPARILSLIGEVRELQADNQRLRETVEDFADSFDLRITWTKQPVMLDTLRHWLGAARRALAGEP